MFERLLEYWRPKNKQAFTTTPELVDIAVHDVRADVPQFKRVYSAKLDNRASIKIIAKTFLGRSLSGELDQPDGRWVLFDPDAIAEKILDPLLVPVVQRYVNEIKRLDKAFMESKPSAFTDESGTVWRREP